MAKRRASSNYRQLGEIITPKPSETLNFCPDGDLDIPTQTEYNSNVDRANIQLKFPAQVIRSGLVSGEQYVWSEAGAIVSVLIEDVDQLLQLKIGEAGCCGGNPNFLFERI